MLKIARGADKSTTIFQHRRAACVGRRQLLSNLAYGGGAGSGAEVRPELA